jgi:putative transcriptional regulator
MDHHPSAEALSDYVRANIAPGAALAIEVHLELCQICAMRLKALEGAANLNGLRPATVDRGAGIQVSRTHGVRGLDDAEEDLPRTLQGASISEWSSLGSNVRVAAMNGVSGLGEQVYLVRGEPNAQLPFRRGSNAELVVVLNGGFRDRGAVFAAGDLVELDRVELRRPMAEGSRPCLCLVVAAGKLRRRLVSPSTRMKRILRRLKLARVS